MSEPHPLGVPAELIQFTQQPCLLPGESRQDFETMRQMILDDVRPQTNIEWLWVLDLVDLSWEILRYRGLKQKILEDFRMIAVESLLRRIDGSGITEEDAGPAVQVYARCSALEWRDDPDAAIEIEARLQRFGFDAVALNAEVYIQARDQLELFEQLMQRAQQRRMALLREIGIRREFAFRAKLASDTVTSDGALPSSKRGVMRVGNRRRFPLR
jgi:hypothetical protein